MYAISKDAPNEESMLKLAYKLCLLATMLPAMMFIVSNSFTIISLGSFQLSGIDVAIAFYCVSGGLMLVYHRVRSRLESLAVLLCALAFIGFIRGIPEFGLASAGNASRVLLFQVLALYLGLALGIPQMAETVERAFLLCGAATVVLFAFRLGIGNDLFVRDANFIGGEDRFLNANAALLLGICSAMLLRRYFCQCDSIARREKQYTNLFAAVICGVVLLVSGQVTATLAFLVGVGVFLFRRYTRYRWAVTLIAFLALLTVMVGIFTSTEEFWQEVGVRFVPEFLSKLSNQEGTGTWRIIGWEALLDKWKDMSELDKFIGQPAGIGFSRFLPSLGYEVNVSPHNHFLFILFLCGLLGFIAFLVLIVTPIFQRSTRPALETCSWDRSFHLALVWMGIVFSLGYQLPGEFCFLLGSVLGISRAS